MKIPFEIQKVRDPDGLERLRVVVSFQDAIINTSLNKQIIDVQEKYREVIKSCQDIIVNIRKSKKNAGDSVLKWYLSDIIYNFLKEVEEEGFILVNLAKSLSRDLGVSVSQINYLIEFRISYPKVEMIDNKISWDKYKEIMDVSDQNIKQLIIQKIINGEIRTREDIRKLKKKRNILV